MKKSFIFLLFTALVLSGCSNWFQAKIPMKGSSTGSLIDLLVKKEVPSSLTAPAQIFASQGASSNEITITWTSVPYAVTYRLEWAAKPKTSSEEPGKDDFSVLSSAVYGTSYTHKLIPNPTYLSSEYDFNYYYRVTSENNRDKYEPSSPSSAVQGSLLSPVKTLNADMGQSAELIRVSWGNAANANSYQIFRTKNSNGMAAEYIDQVPPNQNWYTNKISADEQGIDFYYLVYVLNKNGERSVASPLALGYALVSGAPGQPKNVKITNGRGFDKDSISLEWSPVSAEHPVKYTIYRSSSADSSLTLLNQEHSTVNYTDTKGIKPGIYYYYQIQAWTLDPDTQKKLKSTMSDSGPKAQKPAEGYVLSPPATAYALKDEQNKNSLEWQPALGSTIEQAAYKYQIYGSSDPENGFLPMLTISKAADADNFIRYILSANQNYYRITTLNSAGKESSFSATLAPAPLAAINIAASQHEKLSGSLKANDLGVYPIKITWQKPSNDTPSFYDVYRSSSPDSGFRKITEIPIEADKPLLYIDDNNTAKAGRKYYYKVLALNALKQGKYFTDPAIGWGALTYDQYFREYNKTRKNSHRRFERMNKSNDLEKLGSEIISGLISGTAYYEAKTAGLGARIIISYTNFTDFYIENKEELGKYFTINGNMNTSANMSANGSMDGTITCTGMYPGQITYDNIQIKAGNAGGGYYVVMPEGFPAGNVDYSVGEE